MHTSPQPIQRASRAPVAYERKQTQRERDLQRAQQRAAKRAH